MNGTAFFTTVFALAVFNLSALDITTKDGRIYKNVEVLNVLPNAVGFMYMNERGAEVLRDVPLKDLTEDLRKKFNYSPVKAKKFEKRVKKFRADRARLLEKQRQEDLALFRRHKEFARELDHIKALLRAHSITVWVHIVRAVGQDCIAKLSYDPSTSKYGHLGMFYVRNLTGSQNARIKAVLYPTHQTKSFQDGVFPVYDANLTKYALQLAREHQTPPEKGLPGVQEKKKTHKSTIKIE